MFSLRLGWTHPFICSLTFIHRRINSASGRNNSVRGRNLRALRLRRNRKRIHSTHQRIHRASRRNKRALRRRRARRRIHSTHRRIQNASRRNNSARRRASRHVFTADGGWRSMRAADTPAAS